MDKQTVYTISVGMLPTVGFAKEDFRPDRVGAWQRDKARDSSLGIRGVIGSDGSLRKARIRGSVAWFEYSTTVKAIQSEVLGKTAKQELAQSHADWESKASGGQQELYDDLLSRMGIEGMAPTGEFVQQGAVKGEQPSEQPAHWASGKEDHKGNKAMKKAGKLVGHAKSIDLYFKGKDDKIYRVDVTSMSMDSQAHHGLTSKADRTNQNVTSKQILETLAGPNGFEKAEKNLLTYFQKTQEGWNKVIKRMKDHTSKGGNQTGIGAVKFLENLEKGTTTLNDSNVISRLQRELKKGDKQNFLTQLRGTKKESIRRMRSKGRQALGRQGQKEAFSQAVSFALHMLGNIVSLFAKDSAISGGYSTEFRLGTSDAARNYTIEVKHVIVASGKKVLEFQALKKGDVLLHRESALQHVYQRELIKMERGAQNAIINRTSEVQSEMFASLGMTHDVAGVEIGGATTTIASGLAKDGNNVYQRARTVITPRKFNYDIEKWIAETNTRGDWDKKVDNILRRHIKKYGPIEDVSSLVDGQGKYTQWASPINEGNLNDWSMLAQGGTAQGMGQMYNADPEYKPQAWRDYAGLGQTSEHWTEAEYGKQIIPKGQTHRDDSGRVRAAMIGNPNAKKENLKITTSSYDNISKFRGSKEMSLRSMGLSMGRGLLQAARSGPMGRQHTGKFWGLEEYLSRDTQEGFNDNVNASWWAAPYISILYPSGQVSKAT